jgi:hypothetical protein
VHPAVLEAYQAGSVISVRNGNEPEDVVRAFLGRRPARPSRERQAA